MNSEITNALAIVNFVLTTANFILICAECLRKGKK